MTEHEREVMQDALNAIELAILSGDWIVDGACDPTLVILRMKKCLDNDMEESVQWGVDWSKDGSCVSIIKRKLNGGIEVVAVEYAPPHKI